MPVFTVREISDLWRKMGKSEGGLQFKNERYLNADTIETMKAKNFFKFKGVSTVVQRRKNALFWLVAVPEQFGIALIKSPRAKGNFDLFVLLQDSSFCVEKLDTDLLCLKQKYSDGHNEEIKMYMGL